MSTHHMVTRSKSKNNKSTEVDMGTDDDHQQNGYQQNGYQQNGYQQDNGYQQNGYQQDNGYQQQNDYQQNDGYQQQLDVGYYPMQNMQVSIPNFYDSQQVCCARDISMSEYYQEALTNYPDNINVYLQHLYDLGCSVVNYQIVCKDYNNNFMLNRNFGDYYDWSFAEQNVVNNCDFLRQMGHPLYA